MNVRAVTGLLLCLGLLIAACNGNGADTTTTAEATSDTESDGETSTTTDSSDTTSPPDPTTTTTADLSDYESEAESRECIYLEKYIAVGTPLGDVDNVTTKLNEAGIPAVGVFAEGVLIATTDQEAVNGGYGAAESLGVLIDSHMSVIELTEDDPLVVSMYLRDVENIAASPIHAVGMASHWNFKPGTEAVPLQVPIRHPRDEFGNNVLLADNRDPSMVAVVDSGFADAGLVWMERNGWVYFDNQDREFTSNDNIASHGTFVTSVIRQVSKQAAVSIASAHQVDQTQLKERGELHLGAPGSGTTQPYVTTELHVADAVHRILARSHANLAALNLSLGTYTCDPSSDDLVVTLTETIDQWFTATGNAPVYAAAGNEILDPQQYLWPAALGVAPPAPGWIWDTASTAAIPDPQVFEGAVMGVAAVDFLGDEVVWHEPNSGTSGQPIPIPTGSRGWVKVQAPGSDLISIGNERGETFLWSGSSFATAVASGLAAVGLVEDQQIYAEVSGLTYLNPSGAPVGPGT